MSVGFTDVAVAVEHQLLLGLALLHVLLVYGELVLAPRSVDPELPDLENNETEQEGDRCHGGSCYWNDS